MAGEQLQLSLPDVIKEHFGEGQVQTVNPDGTANVRVAAADGSSQIIKFDPAQYAKANGIDPSKVKVQYNNPEQALNDNPIGFKDGMMMALADSKTQEMFLKGKYDGVMKTKDGFVVNDNGTWKKASPGFLSTLATSLPEMEGGSIGTAAGATLGTFIAGPIGTWAGGMAGGAIGAALASVVKNKGAEALGLRSEADAQEAAKTFGHEVVNNLIWGVALAGTGQVVKAGYKLGKGAVNRVWGSVDKEGLAATAEKLIDGTKKEDWGIVVRSPEDAKSVADGIDQMAKWSKASYSQTVRGPDPMSFKIGTTVRDFMQDAKSAAEKNFGEGLDLIEKSAAGNSAKFDTQVATNNLKDTLMNLGVVSKDEAGQYIIRANPNVSSEGGRILQIFDPSDVRALNKVFQQANNTAGELKFEQMRDLTRGINNILESSGYYKNGEMALSNEARRALISYRADLAKATDEGLKQFNIVKDGVQQNASSFWKNLNGNYSQYREVYDHFAMPSKFGGDLKQVVSTANRMLDPKNGYGLEESFQKLGSAVGKEAEPVLQQLQQFRAAKNLSEMYTPKTGWTAWANDKIMGGPRDQALRLAKAVESKADFQKSWNESLLGKLPASEATKTLVEARARLADHVNKMGMEDIMKFVTNPQALRQTVNAVESSPQVQQSTVGQIMQVPHAIANSYGQDQGPQGQ